MHRLATCDTPGATRPPGRHAYRGTEPEHLDNVGLRAALTHQVPLVYFHGVVPGKYLAAWPVYVVGDQLPGLRNTLVVEGTRTFAMQYRDTGKAGVDDEDSVGRRRYVTAQYRVRLHQLAFRERVLDAYRDQCLLCRLRHRELLDAAHIIPDADPEGDFEAESSLRRNLTLQLRNYTP